MPRKDGYTRTVQNAGRSVRVTLPHTIVKQMGIKGGDDLWFEIHKDHLEVYKVKIQPKTGMIIEESD